MKGPLARIKEAWEGAMRYTPSDDDLVTFEFILEAGDRLLKFAVIAGAIWLFGEIAGGLVHHYQLFGFLWGS